MAKKKPTGAPRKSDAELEREKYRILEAMVLKQRDRMHHYSRVFPGSPVGETFELMHHQICYVINNLDKIANGDMKCPFWTN